MRSGSPGRAATEFSFFLAIPVMFAATLYDLLKSRRRSQPADAPVFAVGFVVSFVSALVVVKAFLGYVSHHSFAAFAWYRIVFGALSCCGWLSVSGAPEVVLRLAPRSTRPWTCSTSWRRTARRRAPWSWRRSRIGAGSRGRAWHSPPGGLWLSVLYGPPPRRQSSC